MKIFILCHLRDGPFGGGNQFLKALRDEFIERGLYVEKPEEADIILFNSFPMGQMHLFRSAIRILVNKPDTVLVHRIDGPLHLIRGRDQYMDNALYLFNRLFTNGTVFQSNWSKSENLRQGLNPPQSSKIITNAPRSKIFHPLATHQVKTKLSVIITSWSSNWRKGFKDYRWLDENLDFKKYSVTFVGNSPIVFKNIQMLEPLANEQLSAELRKHDVFLTGSRVDPCSNSLIEALHTGLPAIVYNDGGHPELVGQAGLVYNDVSQIPELLEKLSKDYLSYRAKIAVPEISEVASKYSDFFENLLNQRTSYISKRHRFNLAFKLVLLYWSIFWGKFTQKIFKSFKT